MDREQKIDWSWLPKQMPKVSKLIAERRAEHGADHVTECWRRGVTQGEPDWFFAREGALAVGTPFVSDGALVGWQAHAIKSGQALVLMRKPGVQHGA